MVTAAELAGALGIGEDVDATWTVLGKVTSVGATKLLVKIGSSSTAVNVERFCDAAIGDIVYIVVEDGVARAIACKGGQSAAMGQSYFGAMTNTTLHNELKQVQISGVPPSKLTDGMLLIVTAAQGSTYAGEIYINIISQDVGGTVYVNRAVTSASNPLTYAQNDTLMFCVYDGKFFLVNKYEA